MATSNQNVKALVIIALVGLFGLNVYQFANNSNLQKDNLSKENELVQLEDAKAKLDKEYQESISDLNDMKTNNEELNRVIDSQKEELRIQKEKIGGLLKDSKNLALARKEMDSFKTRTQDFIAEVNRLKAENAELNTQNTTLQTEKTQLTTEVATKSAENQQLSVAKENLNKEKESLAKEKDVLDRKVNKATAIPVQKVDGEAYQERDGKKPKSVSKAKDVDFVEVCFKTAVNKNTEAGSEKFFIRIISPTGETQAIESEGSGVIRNDTNGETIKYSTTAMTQYSNDEKKVCAKFKNPGSFSAGIYQLEVFNKGYLVGTSSMKLK
jgi:predicted  nucleic acid-binding Zn-ribbon protein